MTEVGWLLLVYIKIWVDKKGYSSLVVKYFRKEIGNSRKSTCVEPCDHKVTIVLIYVFISLLNLYHMIIKLFNWSQTENRN